LPLPPYINRRAGGDDLDRYQTIWATHPGAVAAPTAGLHFDEALLARLRGRGIDFAWITLHVGAGTFQPLRVEALEEHHMHAERVCVSPEACAKIDEVRRLGKRVVAVGTTCVRALESAWQRGCAVTGSQVKALEPFAGETDIFIYPGYEFGVVDALITNFHLPQSTLMMLVSAFAGREAILRAYAHAIERRYRFFSYGDAMLLHRRPSQGVY